MERALKILYIEDQLADFRLVERHLHHHGMALSCHRADGREQLEAALNHRDWDLVLSDYNVPTLPFEDILSLLRPRLEELPLILVSGSVGEERAVELLKQGVWDFVLKDNLTRLVPAVQRSLRDAAERAARRQAETALRESEEKFHQLAGNITDVFWIFSPDLQQAHYVSPAYEQIWGRSLESLFAAPARWSEAILADDRERVLAVFARLRDSQSAVSVEYRIQRQDGTVRWIYDRGFQVLDANGKLIRVAGVASDITARRLAEEERLRLSTALEQAAESIVITDLAATIIYVNPAFERISGFSRAEALGQNPRFLSSGQREAGFVKNLWDTLKRGEVWHGHFINRRKNGALLEEDATISPVRDASGKVVNYMAIKLDVTREVALEGQFRQSQKLEAIGQLAGGVAHDFNNILTSILMQVELASLGSGLPDEVALSLKQIRDDAGRAASLTRQLLLFSRRQVMQSRDLDLNEIVTNLAKMLQRIIGEDVQLQLILHPAPLPTHADPGMLDQVALNLAVNARDAMPGGGRLVIQTSDKIVDAQTAGQNPDALPGRYVCLSVTDNGCGIPPETLPRIFEPFFTTKEIGKGTGLGLATVFGIVKQHRGWLTVDSQPGRGSTFNVYLPALAAAAAVSVPDSSPPARGGKETILLVEDDDAVRKVTVRILSQRGYRVLETIDGADALRVWKENRAAVALLFTDLVMPGGLGGRQLALKLQADKPGLKVIFATGYSAEIAGQEIRWRPGEIFVQKPFRADELLKTIRSCLDA